MKNQYFKASGRKPLPRSTFFCLGVVTPLTLSYVILKIKSIRVKSVYLSKYVSQEQKRDANFISLKFANLLPGGLVTYYDIFAVCKFDFCAKH